jgi:hypothetical protein
MTNRAAFLKILPAAGALVMLAATAGAQQSNGSISDVSRANKPVTAPKGRPSSPPWDAGRGVDEPDLRKAPDQGNNSSRNRD